MPRAKGKTLAATWWAPARPIRFGRERQRPGAEQWAALAHLPNAEAARALGVGVSTVARWRREAGVALPDRPQPRYSLLMGETTRLILQVHLERGLNAAQLAERVGLGVATVQALCRWHGLRFKTGRPRKQRPGDEPA